MPDNRETPKVFKEGEETTRSHLWLYTSDIAWIDSHYGDTIKRSKFIRLAVRRFIRAIQNKAEAQGVAMHEGDLQGDGTNETNGTNETGEGEIQS